MRLFTKYIGLAITLIFLTVSCDTNPSLQKYYIDSKENNEFISVDLPASILQLKSEEVSEEVKTTLESIKKVNFLALQLNETNKELFDSEKLKIKAILKNPKYQQLMRMNLGKGNVSVNYLGEEDAIDEVVIFGSENSKGLAIIRIIGENMNPSDILKLTSELKLDGNSGELKQIGELFSSIK